MNTATVAHSILSAPRSYRWNTVFLTLITIFIHDQKKGPLKWFQKTLKIFFLFCLANAGLYVFAHVNSWLTTYTIDDSSGEYVNTADSLSTDNFRYVTGRGPPPEFMTKKREYIRGMLKSAKVKVPERLDYLDNEELNNLVHKLYTERQPATSVFFDAIFYDIINEIDDDAVAAPLQNISDEDYDNLVLAMKMAHGVKLRWIGDRKTGGYFRMLMTASSPEGDDQNFHSSLEGIMYVRYGDSVQGILDELAHPIAFHKAPYTYYVKLIYGSVRSIVRAVIRLPETAYELHQEDYDNESTFEGGIHKGDKPKLLKELNLDHLDKEAPKKPAKEHLCVMPNQLSINNN